MNESASLGCYGHSSSNEKEQRYAPHEPVRRPKEATMGYSISWLMVNGKARQAVLNDFGLETTGKSGEFSDFRIAGHALPNGAYLLVMRKCDHPFTSNTHLAQVSVGCKALACSIEEHVMYAYAIYWENGRNLWSLKHQGDTDEGRNDLTVSGTPPDSLTRYVMNMPGSSRMSTGISKCRWHLPNNWRASSMTNQIPASTAASRN